MAAMDLPLKYRLVTKAKHRYVLVNLQLEYVVSHVQKSDTLNIPNESPKRNSLLLDIKYHTWSLLYWVINTYQMF